MPLQVSPMCVGSLAKIVQITWNWSVQKYVEISVVVCFCLFFAWQWYEKCSSRIVLAERIAWNFRLLTWRVYGPEKKQSKTRLLWRSPKHSEVLYQLLHSRSTGWFKLLCCLHMQNDIQVPSLSSVCLSVCHLNVLSHLSRWHFNKEVD